MLERTDISAPHDGHCYVSKNSHRNGDEPIKPKNNLKDDNRQRRSGHTEQPTDYRPMGKQRIHHKRFLVRLTPSVVIAAPSTG